MSKIIISGEYPANIDEACKSICDLMTPIHRFSFNLSANLVNELSKKNITRAAFIRRFSKMCQKSNAVISISGNTIDIEGSASAIVEATKQVHEVEEIIQILQNIVSSTDMASMYKDFISGKKNGKLNKISKSTNTDIQLIEKERHILTISIVSESLSLRGSFDAFTQLQVCSSYRV
jgi:hypothetical protein